MNQTEQKAIKTYHDNLNYFEKNHPKLYEKLFLLENAISNGIYKEKYSLEYKTEGYFDVLEIESGHYLYGSDSNTHAKTLVDSLDFSRVNGVFEAQRFVDFSPEMPDIIDQSKLHFHNALWATIKLIEYSKKVAPRSTNMKQVYKLLFLGIGLGLHIPGAIEKLGAKIVYLQEHNLELFRLSLFVTQYKRLAKQTKLFFSVMDSEEELRNTFNLFLETGNNYNLYLKQISLTETYQDDLFRYQDYVIRQEHIVYPYSAYLLRYIDSPRYITQGYPFLNVSTMVENPIWSNKPVLLLFSGPSTAKHIEWVKQNRDRFVIATALSTCRYLNKEGIIPDIIVHIDPEEDGSLLLLQDLPEGYFHNVLSILASNTHPSVVKHFNKSCTYFVEQATNYKKGFGSFSSPTVGEYTYALLLIFGAQEIYLLGIDLALDPDTLLSHVPLHPFASSGEASNDQLDKMLIEVEGNLLPKVPTYPMYRLSIEQFGRMSEMFKKGSHVYNLSNGARLKGAEPLEIEKFDVCTLPIIESSFLHNELKTFFDSLSSSEFREEDKEILYYQLQEAKKLKTVIQNFKKLKFMMPSLYISALANLNYTLSDMEKKTNSYLAEVYYLYFKVVLSYISEIFNTKELDSIKTHIDNINAILINQLEKIANTYIDALEEYLEGH